jgi:hypothetical protein
MLPERDKRLRVDRMTGLQKSMRIFYGQSIHSYAEDPMTTNLSDDLRHAFEQGGGSPVHLVDATTNERYVLMRADQYEKVKAIFECEEQDFDPREAYPFVDEVMRDDDANDPALESYQSFTKRES